MNTINSKSKLLATITIMLLFASAMLAVVPTANAVSAANVSPLTGSSGDVVEVTATADNAGSTLVAYWNSISEANRLNSTRLTGSGRTASFDVTIPDARRGEYAIIVVEELTSGGTSNAATRAATFTVVPKIALKLEQDTRGSTVTITGTGFNSSSSNNVNFDFDIGAGTGYDMSSVAPSNVRPNNVGSFTVTFRVPNDAKDDTYLITATGSGTTPIDTADATFTVGPVITISPDNGAQGTRATLTGRGFAADAVIQKSNIYFDNTAYGLFVDTDQTIKTDDLGRFSVQIVVNKAANWTSASANWQKITVEDNAGNIGKGEFRIHRYGVASIVPNVRAGEPTTATGQGSLITVTGSNFASGSHVNLTLVKGTARISVATFVPVSASGSFVTDFIIPGLETGLYTIEAEGEYGMKVTYQNFGITILYVGLYDGARPVTTSVPTGTTIRVQGLGFNIFGTSYIANVSIGDQVVHRNIGHTQVMTNGVDIVIGVDGSTMAPGTYPVTITTNEGLTASATLTVSEVAKVTVTPKTAPRDSQLNITGVNFSPGSIARIEIRNATTNARVASLTTTVNSTGGFSVIPAKTVVVPADFKLGDYVINVTDSKGVTAETPLTVAKVEITIALGANSYAQGDIATFQLTSNTAPSGKISVYDVSGAWVTTLDLDTKNWALTASGTYVYQQSNVGGVPYGALLQLASDARVGTWTWNATINDAKEPQTYKGTFAVTSKSATPTTAPPTTAPPTIAPPTIAPPTTAPPTDAPTSTPNPGTNWNQIIIIIAVIALIVGVIAVFLFITMRQKIAN
jgi:hypothetical protein